MSVFLWLLVLAVAEDGVAGTIESLPDFVGIFARYGSDFPPMFAQLFDFVLRIPAVFVVQIFYKAFCFFAKANFILQVVFARLFLNIQLVAAAVEKVVANAAESGVQLLFFGTATRQSAPFVL